MNQYLYVLGLSAYRRSVTSQAASLQRYLRFQTGF
jgi:hypothetical protein